MRFSMSGNPSIKLLTDNVLTESGFVVVPIV